MYNRIIRESLVFGILALCLGASLGSAITANRSGSQQTDRGNILYVGGSGDGNYSTIQEAINNASNGDTIFVYSNTYSENIDTKLKKITLLGENMDATIIQGPTAANPVVRIGTSEVVLSGFTIIGTTNQIVVQVSAVSENVVISHNVIQNGGYGISLQITTSRATITDNVITGSAFVGIQLQTSTYDVISFNTIENCGGQGLVLSLSSGHNSIVNNTIRNNAKEGITLDGVKSTDNTISGNNVSGNEVGIRFKSAGSNKIMSNIIQESLREGILLSMSSENTISANNFINNKRQAAYSVSSRNSWDANYWSNWIGFKATKPIFQSFPKCIHGIVLFTFDWHPAKQPYNITGFP